MPETNPGPAAPPQGNWWDVLTPQPSTVPVVSLLQGLAGMRFKDPKTGAITHSPYDPLAAIGDVYSNAIGKPFSDLMSWAFSPQGAPAAPAATPTPDPTPAPPPAKDPTEPYLTIPGTLKSEPPPTPPHIAPVDYSKYRAALDAAAPVAPIETQDDKIAGVLAGLAAGMQNVTGGGTNVGNLLLNLGMGALGGLAGEKASYKKAMQAYQDSLQSFKEKQAGSELGIAEQRGKESKDEAAIQYGYAQDLWKYHQEQNLLVQPKVLSTKGGVVTIQERAPDGTLKIHTIGTTAPTDKPYYVTQAGELPADQTISAGYAGIDNFVRTGTLAGNGSQFLLDPNQYKQFQQQASAQATAEMAANPALQPKDQSKLYYSTLYQLIWNFAQEKGQTDLILGMGQKFGQQKVSKSVATPETSDGNTE